MLRSEKEILIKVRKHDMKRYKTDILPFNFFFFACGAATQRGSWPPYPSGF